MKKPTPDLIPNRYLKPKWRPPSLLSYPYDRLSRSNIFPENPRALASLVRGWFCSDVIRSSLILLWYSSALLGTSHRSPLIDHATLSPVPSPSILIDPYPWTTLRCFAVLFGSPSSILSTLWIWLVNDCAHRWYFWCFLVLLDPLIDCDCDVGVTESDIFYYLFYV